MTRAGEGLTGSSPGRAVVQFLVPGGARYYRAAMMEPIERLSLGRYQGVIDYPEGYRLEELEVLVDTDGNVAVRWLELPGKPSLISREATVVGDTYTVAFADGTTMRLREQHA